MNRERLKILRDHLAGLPDELVMMNYVKVDTPCGTAGCIGGWAGYLSGGEYSMTEGGRWLALNDTQHGHLFWPNDTVGLDLDALTRADAIAAIDSMLANPDDDALPVWPEKAVRA